MVPRVRSAKPTTMSSSFSPGWLDGRGVELEVCVCGRGGVVATSMSLFGSRMSLVVASREYEDERYASRSCGDRE